MKRLVLSLVVLLSSSLAACARSAPSPALPTLPLEMPQAIGFVTAHLQARGIRDVALCHGQFIEAPVGGYIFDAVGSWKNGDITYTTFRVGVSDGSDSAEYRSYMHGETGVGPRGDSPNPGDEFLFIAYGHDRAGNEAWIPAPGPRKKADYFQEEYEFLNDSDPEDLRDFTERSKWCRRPQCGTRESVSLNIPWSVYAAQISCPEAVLDGAELATVQDDHGVAGVRLGAVRPSSPFDLFGLCDGDVVLTIRGRAVTSPRDLLHLFRANHGQFTEDTEPVVIRRDGRELTLKNRFVGY